MKIIKFLTAAAVCFLAGLPFSACAAEPSAADLPSLQSKAEKGDAEAQMNLGIYYYSKSPDQNIKLGISWIQKAAEQGYFPAEDVLGDTYAASQNYVEAVKWYQKAAEQQDTAAIEKLSAIYLHGEKGVPQDTDKATEWAQKSANSVGGKIIPSSQLVTPEQALAFRKSLSEKQLNKLADLSDEYAQCGVYYVFAAQCMNPDLKGAFDVAAHSRKAAEQANNFSYLYFVQILGGKQEALIATVKGIADQTKKELDDNCLNLSLFNERLFKCKELLDNPNKPLSEIIANGLPYPATKEYKAVMDSLYQAKQ